MNHPIPKTISKYQIKKVLGQGAMGIVYLGFDEQIERHVAIKTIAFEDPNKPINQDLAERFLNEAKLLAKCTHPNIVTILEFGQQDHMAYMVMEYIQGQSLKDLLKKRQGLPLKTVMSMFVQLLKALHTAHNNDIIHRDLKPENILLANKNTLKLTDFGIAKSDETEMMTQIGVTVGTPKYMAPEQMYGSDDMGPYTDIYSLFVILYELMGHVSDAAHHDMGQLPTLSQLAKHNKFDPEIRIPLDLHAFVCKGLSVSHLDRYENTAEVVRDLKPLLGQLKGQLTPQTATADEDETTGFFTTGTVVTQSSDDWVIDDQQFEQMRLHLSDLMGPVADFILTHALKKSHSYDQFIMQIAEKLDNQTVRETFIDRWRTL